MARRNRLRFISDYFDARHRIYAVCHRCRRSKALDLQTVMRRHGPTLTIPELERRLRCRQCNGDGDVRVVLTSHDGR